MKLGDALQSPPDKKSPETIDITKDRCTISLPKTRIHTLEQLIEYCEIDLSIWEVERFIANKWEMGAKNADSELIVEPLFQIKATLRKRIEIADAKKEIEELKALASKASSKPTPVIRTKVLSGNMLEVNIPDLHAGKLAWGSETGGPNYDTKIAVQEYRTAVDALLSRVSHFKFDLILLVIGNDLLNSDDVEGRTTKGTHVSTDSRYHNTFSAVRNLTIETIEKLRQIAPVKVVPVSGNHDALSVWHLGDSLECYFHKYKDVEIDNSPKNRKYHRFGNVMLMFTHGDKGKTSDYPLLMATEQAEMFGATLFREAHTGHRHKTKLDEQHGVRVRILPALCAADDWHAENGFVGNLRNAEAYVWNKEEGLIGIAIYSVREQA